MIEEIIDKGHGLFERQRAANLKAGHALQIRRLPCPAWPAGTGCGRAVPQGCRAADEERSLEGKFGAL